jgi:hypothetical protein
MMSGGWMMGGMGLIGLLLVIVLVLGIAALAKYLMSDRNDLNLPAGEGRLPPSPIRPWSSIEFAACPPVAVRVGTSQLGEAACSRAGLPPCYVPCHPADECWSCCWVSSWLWARASQP